MFSDDVIVDNNALEIIQKAYNDTGCKWAFSGFCGTRDGENTYEHKVPMWTDYMLEGRNLLSSPSVVSFLNECKLEFDENLKLFLDTDFYHRMRWEHGMPHIIKDVLVANRDHNERISSHATSQYDGIFQHPEGGWQINISELNIYSPSIQNSARTGNTQMRPDLKDTTFIIPIRIESEDRLRNVITTTCFLLDNFDTNILIREVDATSVFVESALPQIYEFCDDISGLKHSFVKSDSPTFHRQKVLNEMIDECSTDIVVNYDCDVLLPIRSYCAAVDAIRELRKQMLSIRMVAKACSRGK